MDVTDQTIQAYEECFDQYSKKKVGSGPSVNLLRDFINLLSGKKVLEIGFGLGEDATWLVEQGIIYTGVDPVRKFCQNFPLQSSQITIISQDIRNTNFPNKSFDGIWAMAVFLHFNDKDLLEILTKAHSWLNTSGILFISLKEGRKQYIRNDGRYFNLFTKTRFLKMIKDKFKVVRLYKKEAKPFNTGSENWLSFYLKKI